MPIYGVIDTGSNTIRLVVFKVSENNSETFSNGSVKKVFDHKVTAGLAAYVRDGKMSKVGLKKAAKVLTRMRNEAEIFSCTNLHVFATAALRNCSNSEEAVAWLEEQTGITIDVISGAEEAHLSFLGASRYCRMDQGVFIDLGGGSLEVMGIGSQSEFDRISLEMGALSTFRNHVSGFMPTSKEEKEIRHMVKQAMSEESELLRDSGCMGRACYGTGGSIRTMAKIATAFEITDTSDPKRVTAHELDIIIERAIKEPESVAHNLFRFSPERAHTIIPACIMIRELMSLLGVDHIDVCKGGVREGYLAERVLAVSGSR